MTNSEKPGNKENEKDSFWESLLSSGDLSDTKKAVTSDDAKQWLKKNWFKLSLLTIILVTSSFFAYWTQIKPANARKNCFEVTTDLITEENKSGDEFHHDDYYFWFDICLNSKGIKS